jgi:hypothetical protein
MHDLETLKKRNAMPASYIHAPHKGEMIFVLNYYSNGIAEQVAIITRVIDPKTVNVMVLPDGGIPSANTDLPFFQSKRDALAHLATLPPDLKNNVPVGYWPHQPNYDGVN